MKLLTLCALSALTLLTACGGGSGGGKSIDINATPTLDNTGILIPSIAEEDANGNPIQTVYKIVIGGKTYQEGDTLSVKGMKQGFNELPYSSSQTYQDGYTFESKGKIRLYRQDYSYVWGELSQWDNETFGNTPLDDFSIITAGGTYTRAIDMPRTGTYTYEGQAFNGKENNGKLSYTVDFWSRRGAGSITGLKETGRIELKSAPIRTDIDQNRNLRGISGQASAENFAHGDYSLGFFGPGAKEIAGFANLGSSEDLTEAEVGFAGKR